MPVIVYHGEIISHVLGRHIQPFASEAPDRTQVKQSCYGACPLLPCYLHEVAMTIGLFLADASLCTVCAP